MGVSPPKIWRLCAKCCGCYALEAKHSELRKQPSGSVDAGSGGTETVSVFSNPNRPLDLIGFLGNEHIFLLKPETATSSDDEEENEAEPAVYELVSGQEDEMETEMAPIMAKQEEVDTDEVTQSEEP